MANHGVYVTQKATSVGTPITARSGIPFVIGAAPVQCAAAPAPTGIPVLCTSWSEAVERLGYSEDWGNYPLCEFMYSHFKLFQRQPVIFCNLLDTHRMRAQVAAADMDVTDHKLKLPLEAVGDGTLEVKASGGTGDAYVEDTDYSIYYDGEHLVVEALPDGACYSAGQLNVAYAKVTPSALTDTAVAVGMESIELCMSTLGVVPDLICAPGFSGSASVAAAMTTKAGGINGLFRAKALIDISTATDSATTYTNAITAKGRNNLVDPDQIVCWPMLGLGGRKFHMSTQLAGLMAEVDEGNDGCPCESPSNKRFQCDSMLLADGVEVNLTLAQANILGSNGIVTALNFMGGWVCWGNYTACYPGNTDVKDYFIPVSRMFGWVGNTLVKTFWSRLDENLKRRLIDNIVESVNLWLNGLVGAEYLLGGRVEFRDEENPLTDLMAGIIRLHVYMTPASPAQEIAFTQEYDMSYITSALS